MSYSVSLKKGYKLTGSYILFIYSHFIKKDLDLKRINLKMLKIFIKKRVSLPIYPSLKKKKYIKL